MTEILCKWNSGETINMSYGATVGASAANSNLIEFKK